MAAILELHRLTKRFAGLAAVKDVSFGVEQGEICGLIGPNGAGKTTVLSMVAGALKPTSGRVVFHSRDVAGTNSFRMVHAGIVRTHQIPKPFRSLTLRQNVEVGLSFGRRGKRGTAAHEPETILERVGLAAQADSCCSTLSVGDQKRLELARALAAHPDLLLCDEVCSGLTGGETESILQLLLEIRRGGTSVLYVEHNLKAIMSVCDRVVVMTSGQKLAEGSPEAVQNDPAVVEAYIGRPEGT